MNVLRILPHLVLAACGARSGLEVLASRDAGGSASSSGGDGAAEADGGGSLDATDDGVTPDAVAPCVLASLTTLAGGQKQPQAIAVDDAYVYWANIGTAFQHDGSIVRVAKCGGTPVTLATGQDPSASIAVDSAGVYWGSVPAGNVGEGALLRTPKAGGTVSTLAAGVYAPLYVALDTTSLYWSSPIAATIGAIPKAGGAVTALATGQGNPHEITVSQGEVVWLDVGVPGSTGAIGFVPTGGGMAARIPIDPFPNGFVIPSGLAVRGATAYTWESGTLWAYPFGDGVPSQLAVVGTSVAALATDGVSIYVADPGAGAATDAGAIEAVSLAGGAVTNLLSGIRPAAVALDGQAVYWVDTAAGTVMGAPR